MVRIRYEKKNISFYIFFFFLSEVKAVNILDHETNIFINNVINTIKKVNNFQNKITFFIILDDNPNAFINKNNKLYISTGLIKYTSSYEAMVGVIAHEIGHLSNFHISKKIESSKKLQNLNKLGNMSIIAGSLIAKNSDYLIQSIVTNQLGINNYYQSFSREQEREADFYSINTLNKLNVSNIPLIKFLEFLEKKSKEKGITREYYKFSTHPIYKERYEIIKKTANNNKKIFDKKMNDQFKNIQAKIFGFTTNDINELPEFLEDNYLNYAKSIALSRNGKLKESMVLLNRLIESKKNYSYAFETKADILYSYGYLNEALEFYKKIIKLHPDNHYVNKRIFNIKFTKSLQSVNMNTDEAFFNNYSYLLNIFIDDRDLKNKFNQLAKKNNKLDWIYYFSIDKRSYKNKSEIKMKISKLENLLKTTNDINLKKMIIYNINIIKDE